MLIAKEVKGVCIGVWCMKYYFEYWKSQAKSRMENVQWKYKNETQFLQCVGSAQILIELEMPVDDAPARAFGEQIKDAY